MPKNALISHTSNVILKILQARFQQYMNCVHVQTHVHVFMFMFVFIQMFKLDSEKIEEPEVKLPTSVGSSKKQENSRKISTSALLTMPKPLIVWITTNCGKFFKRWE